MNPFQLFEKWYNTELRLTKVNIPSACCLSTIGVDDYPNARFVSLKDVTEERFIITGPLHSRKGIEIEKCNKVALTFWWTETQRQVRIQGEATKISTHLADRYFDERSKESQIVSIVSQQGQIIESLDLLYEAYKRVEIEPKDEKLQRQKDWGGFSIEPIRFEFFKFSQTRFHERRLFERSKNGWTISQIQP